MNILVIENDSGFREAWTALLRSFGYHCVALSSLEDQRVEDIHATGYDLVLVDRRIEDDQDELDAAGQTFAVELCKLGTASVLVTGFLPSERDVFDLLWTGSITGLASKSIDMYELAKCVEEFRVTHRFPNCVAKFRWKGEDWGAFTVEDWERVRSTMASPVGDGADFAVLFRSLIPPFAHTVELQPISPGHGGTALFRAQVSSGDGPVVEDVAIKYGVHTTVRSEAMRYDRHVGPLPDGVAAHLRWRKETQKLGALAYSWVGDSIEDGIPFGPIGTKPDLLTWRRRRAALERLFSVSLDPWYRVYRSDSARSVKPHTLLDYYTGPDGNCKKVPFVDESLPLNLPSPVTQDGSSWDFGPYGKLIDPAKWLAHGKGSELELTRYCPCHGDLHVKNIFVLPDDSPRLIDFGETGLGHVFRDFAALEVSLRLTCGNVTEISVLKVATDCASHVSSLGEYINYREVGHPLEHSDLRETVRAVMQIRRGALDAAGDNRGATTMKEYFFAVALQMLRYASGITDEAPSKESNTEKAVRTWHALYAAASAAQRASSLVD